MSKKRLYCPFCSRIFNAEKIHLWTMGNGDYVYFECEECKNEFWILEEDFDKLGKERE